MKKDNVEYLKPNKGKINYEIRGLKIKFENLFNGDKILGESFGITLLEPAKSFHSMLRLKILKFFFFSFLFPGPETNNFLNENWKEVSKELGPELVEALAEIVNLILSNVSSLVPFNELFPETV